MAKILLIEDQRFILQIFDIVLKGAGHTVVAAADGAAGLRLFSSEAPDLVITDVALPDTCGIDVMRTIKSRASIPVIVLTAGGANRHGDYLEQARTNGAFEVFQKPVSSDQLLAAVDRALRPAA